MKKSYLVIFDRIEISVSAKSAREAEEKALKIMPRGSIAVVVENEETGEEE